MLFFCAVVCSLVLKILIFCAFARGDFARKQVPLKTEKEISEQNATCSNRIFMATYRQFLGKCNYRQFFDLH